MRRYALPIRRSSRLCSSWRQRGFTDVTHPFAFTFPVRLEEIDALRGLSGVHLAPTAVMVRDDACDQPESPTSSRL
jgi:hypothetical protein